MKLALLEREFKNLFVACRNSDTTPTMATRSATVNTAVELHDVCDYCSASSSERIP